MAKKKEPLPPPPTKDGELITQITEKLEAFFNDPNRKQITVYDLGPFSVSRLKLLEKCRLKFFLDQLLKVTPKPLTEGDGMLRHIGHAAHFALEQMIIGVHFREAMEETKNRYHDILGQDWGTVEGLLPNMLNFVDRVDVFKTKHRITQVFTEQKLAITKDLKPCDFYSKEAVFRGIIDLRMTTERRDNILVDHKNGGDPEHGLKNYSRQLDATKVLARFGTQEGCVGAQGGIHFITAGDVRMDTYKRAEIIETVMARELFQDIADAVINTQEAGVFKQDKACSICDYCDYRHLCKAEGYKRGTAGELEFVVQESKKMFGNLTET